MWRRKNQRNQKKLKRKNRLRKLIRSSVFNLSLASLALSLFCACQPKQKQAETGKQVLRLGIGANVKGLDPILSDDLYSAIIIHEVYEGLFQYHYLKRPVELMPAIAEAMPTVSEDGLVYDIKLKQGIHFIDDPCFAATEGKGRELVAEDFVYSIKRIADTKNRSVAWWLFQDRIVGLDDFHKASAVKDQPTDYAAKVEGLQAVDKHTLRIKLNKPYPQLLYALAMPATKIIAKEAVSFYGDEFINHAVGTGPFFLKEWRRGSRLVLQKNPDFRDELYPSEGEPNDELILADAGKKVPFVDEVVISVFRESQPLWLNFMRGNIDAAGIPKDNFDDSINKEGNLKPDLVKKGIELTKYPYPDVTYTAFNMKDPILGKHRGIRQAMSLAYNTEKRIDLLYNGRAITAQGPIPPSLGGYDETLKNPFKTYDPEKAKKVLAEAGFPGGKGLPVFEYETMANTTSRQFDELFKREMEAIGIRIKFNSNTWPEMTAKVNQGKYQLFSIAWHADYPDAENFLALFYSKNHAPGVNSSNYKNREFDRLYEKIRTMPDSPERTELYKRMAKMVILDCPWIFGIHRLSYALNHAWLVNYRPHPISRGMLKYYRIDTTKKQELIRNF